MNEWLKRIFTQLRELWGKWTPLQKVILAAVVGGAILGLVLIIAFSASPSMVPLIGVPVADEQLLSRIVTRLDAEGASYTVTDDGRVLVSDEASARRLRSILIREDLIPPETDPWAIFDVDRWTITDFERNINLRRAITQQLEQHIEALDDIDNANVNLTIPERELFQEDQLPVTASIVIVPKPGSDITENRTKLEGIVKLVQFAVGGLTEENIVVTDQTGRVLNDFANLADFDRLELTRRELRTKQDLESSYKRAILSSLQRVYSADRVEIVNLDITLDLSQRTIQTEEHYPITLRPDNPQTPYDESEVTPSITISKEIIDEQFTGTGFSPEGPAGQEGQTPPAFRDLESMVGRYSRSNVVQNEVVNTRSTTEQRNPWQIQRVTVGVALDGVWRRVYNENGEIALNPDGSISREYVPVSDEDLAKARVLIEHAIGFDRTRGDSVTVQHIPFDRTEQQEQENLEYRNRLQRQQTILYVLAGFGVILVAFIVFRMVARELERRRRLREEELARQHQAMREAALRSAEEEGVQVEMSVEERARLEMQENAINMAREHPEDVAQLIRTWLMEE